MFIGRVGGNSDGKGEAEEPIVHQNVRRSPPPAEDCLPGGSF